MVRIRGGRHHDFFRPVEYRDCKFLEKPPDKTDEEQGQAFALDERIAGEHQEVLYISSGLVSMTYLDAHHACPESSIKLYAWEHAFLRRILFVRNEEELKMLKKIGIYSVRVLSRGE